VSEALELVRSIFEAWGRGDFSSVAWADPAIVLVIVGGPVPGHWQGLAAIGQVARAFLSPWEDLRIDADRYQLLSGEHVIGMTHTTVRDSAGGAARRPVGVNPAVLFQVKDDKVARLVVYWDGDRALSDIGLVD
jgi:ketosteroid isomerase-like protein